MGSVTDTSGTTENGLEVERFGHRRDVTFSILIVSYNARDTLPRVFASLDAQQRDDFEVIVLDNASSDGSAEVAEGALRSARFPGALIRSRTNLGFAAGNNLASKQAGGQWLCLLNPDAYPEPDWLDALAAATGQHPDADCFGSRQLQAADTSRADGCGDVVHISGLVYRGAFGWPVSNLPSDDQIVASACGAALMIRAQIFDKLGGFCRQFFCYCEDIDLGLRLLASGGHTVQLASAVVLHEGSASTGRRSSFSVYHGQRNRIWLFRRHLAAQHRLLLAPLHMGATLLLFLTSGWRTPAAFWRGIWHGWTQAVEKPSRRAPIRTLLPFIAVTPSALLRRAPHGQSARSASSGT